MRRFLVSLFFLALAVGLAGCAANRYSAEFASSPNAPYTLGSGDRVRVIVFGQDSLSNSYAVDGSGNIFMPLIGIVPAQGKTIEGLSRAIDAKLRNGYLRDPQVSVEVEAYRPFFILGEVTTPGQYPYINGMTAEKAVAVNRMEARRLGRGVAPMDRGEGVQWRAVADSKQPSLAGVFRLRHRDLVMLHPGPLFGGVAHPHTVCQRHNRAVDGGRERLCLLLNHAGLDLWRYRHPRRRLPVGRLRVRRPLNQVHRRD